MKMASHDDDVEKQAREGSAMDDSVPPARPRNPVVCIVIGMAGSGKTTLMQRLNAHLHEHHTPRYSINLDPAVTHMPFGANIDIRDTVKYKEVMKHYNLGPNGGIVTSLNLFSTRFDQVMQLVERRAGELKYILLDTPGQIEVFTWSASGQIITETLASTFPTVIVYVIDTPRCNSPVTFMSNMLYACSILYKTRLPFVILFNKVDIVSHDFAAEWMHDHESFQEALKEESSYSGELARSMSLMLEEFYKNIKTVGCSAATGEGVDDLFRTVDTLVDEYFEYYVPSLERKKREAEEKEKRRRGEELEKFRTQRTSDLDELAAESRTSS